MLKRSMDAPPEATLEWQPCADGGGASISNHRSRRAREELGKSTADRPGHGFSVFSVKQPVHLISLDQYLEQQQQLLQPQYGAFTGLSLSPSVVEHRHGSNSDGMASSNPSSNLSAELAEEILRQEDALDLFIREQGEQLRQMMAIKMSNMSHSLLLAAEQRFGWILSEKEKELEDARRHYEQLLVQNVQLAADLCTTASRVKILESEVEFLCERIKIAPNGAANVAMGADAGPIYTGPDQVVGLGFGPMCKGCITRPASVLVLPCQHLCYCSDCTGSVMACPVCFGATASTIEVNFS